MTQGWGHQRIRAAVAAVLAMVGLALLPAPAASAKAPAGLPAVTDGEVVAFARLGSRVVVGGTFTTLRLPGGTTVSQPRLFAYDFATGVFDPTFRPALNGAVLALAAPADGSGLYVGGSFTTINGVSRARLARLLPDGTVDAAFSANASAKVQALSLSGTRLFVGGQFVKLRGVSRLLLGEVDARTGALAPGFTVGITGTAAVGGFTGVAAVEVNSTGDRLLVAHTGHFVGGLERYGVAVVDISGPTATVTPWYTTLWTDALPSNGGTVRITDAAWGPDGTWFVTTNTGGDRPPVNDSVQRFDTTTPAPAAPAWVTRQFDSAYAVEIGPNNVVYTGGHFQFTEAPGSDEPFPGDPAVNYGFGLDTNGARVLGAQVVHRQQIDALDPTTGKALNWWSSADGLHGVSALKVWGDKLLVGHDGQHVDGQALGRHGMAEAYGAPVSAALPRSVVSAPLIGANLDVGLITVTGSATAPSGSTISRVQVEVKRTGVNQWLRPDGSWGAYYAFVAPLASPGSRTTLWTLDVMLPAMGDYQLLVRARDSAGRNENPKVSVPLLLNNPSNPPPSLTWTYPRRNQADFTSNTITLSGTVADPDGVGYVSLSFRNTDVGQFLESDGTLGDFALFPATLSVPGGTASAWSVTVTLPNGAWTATARSGDLLGSSDAGSNLPFRMSPGNPPPTLTLDAPVNNAIVPASLTLSGTAADDVGVNRVLVRITDARFGLSPQVGGTFGSATSVPAVLAAQGATSTTWSLAVADLPTGTYFVTAWAEDTQGILTRDLSRPAITVRRWPSGAPAEPTTSLTAPGSDERFSSHTVTVSGTASYGPGVSQVLLAVRNEDTNRYLLPDGTATSRVPGYFPAVLGSPGSSSTGWTGSVTVPFSSKWRVDAVAVGTDGNRDSSPTGSRINYLVYPGDADPTIELNSPTDGATISGTGGVLSAGGRAFDDVGVAGVELFVRNPAGTQGIRPDGSVGSQPGWLAAFVTNPGGTFTNWNYTSPALPAGTWLVSARTVDSVGKAQLTYPTVTVTVAP